MEDLKEIVRNTRNIKAKEERKEIQGKSKVRKETNDSEEEIEFVLHKSAPLETISSDEELDFKIIKIYRIDHVIMRSSFCRRASMQWR